MSCKLQTSRYYLLLLLAVVATFRAVSGTGKTPVHYDLTSMPRSCTEAMGMLPAHNGIYTIFLPDSDLRPFKVYCMEDEMGEEPWTVIQRRFNGETDFFRGWEEYKNGFGNINENFWLGLDKISAITNDPANPHELWVSLTATHFYDAWFSHFVVGNEFELYKLKSLGNYTGTARDSLRYHLGRAFSTYDFDNDADSTNCARSFHGAWWYHACYHSNLNGLYGQTGWEGMRWLVAGSHQLMDTTLMAVRPRKK